MANHKFDITLTDEERELLNKIIAEGKESNRTILRARILLLSDSNSGCNLTVIQLAKELGTSDTTVINTRRDYGTLGFEGAVYRKARTRTRSSDEIVEKIVELSKQRPPEGKKKWSLVLLCEESTRRGIVSSIKPTTMMHIMHEHNPGYAEGFKEECPQS